MNNTKTSIVRTNYLITLRGRTFGKLARKQVVISQAERDELLKRIYTRLTKFNEIGERGTIRYGKDSRETNNISYPKISVTHKGKKYNLYVHRLLFELTQYSIPQGMNVVIEPNRHGKFTIEAGNLHLVSESNLHRHRPEPVRINKETLPDEIVNFMRRDKFYLFSMERYSRALDKCPRALSAMVNGDTYTNVKRKHVSLFDFTMALMQYQRKNGITERLENLMEGR